MTDRVNAQLTTSESENSCAVTDSKSYNESAEDLKMCGKHHSLNSFHLVDLTAITTGVVVESTKKECREANSNQMVLCLLPMNSS